MTYIPSQAPTGAPMNDVELDNILINLQIEAEKGHVHWRTTKTAIQALFTQEKANLQAALEAELPKKYPNLRRDNYYERGQNIAIDKCAEAIAAVFNKEGKK